MGTAGEQRGFAAEGDLEPSFHLVSEDLEEPLPYIAYCECIGADYAGGLRRGPYQ